ncbi:ABC transporter permease [Gracilibacillus massiliensis]|uniref:ABC transporter permease n=1 Tax=Gracilibacillus massiliensis TaxID=1564956 RepID=UPI00071CFF8D|nr:ABC transporter permease [Gracilibacillus massiliensis]
MLYDKTFQLLFFTLRQNRVASLIWAISLVGVTVLTASAFTGLYQSDQERQSMAQTMENPAMTAMVGPGYGLDNYTNGAMMAHQMLLFTAIVFAVMSILLITKMTRAEEEEGKQELLRSLPVGRLSSLSASVIFVTLLNIVIGLLIGFGLIAMNLGGMGMTGSILYGLTLTVTGLWFTSITALISQLSETSRGVVGLSFLVLIVAYLLRAIGDVSSEVLSLISPLGLVLRTEVYVQNYWWPILVTIVVSLVFTLIAFYLNNNRDIGAGLLPSKPGKREGSRWLLSPLGLILRLQRTAIISWVIVMFFLGASYGSVLGDLEAFFENNEVLMQMVGDNSAYSMTEQFITMLMVVLAIMATVPAVLVFLRVRGEEKKGRTEHLLTRGISRFSLIAHYLIIAILLGIVSLFLANFGLWFASSQVMEEPIPFVNLLKAGLSYLPAMLLVLMIAVLLFAWKPKSTPLVWLYLVYSFFTVYLGGLIEMPAWLADLSSFSHIPQLPVDEFNWTPILILLFISTVGLVFSFISYRRRDALG